MISPKLECFVYVLSGKVPPLLDTPLREDRWSGSMRFGGKSPDLALSNAEEPVDAIVRYIKR